MKHLTVPHGVRSTTISSTQGRQRLVVSGRDMLSGERTEISFARSTERQLHLRIDGDDYVLTGLEITRVLLPATPAGFSITAITGTCGGDRPGAMVITVDCAREPPALSVASRWLEADPRSWSLQIDHDIQHQLLGLLSI
jgi:hypothetical protein